MRVTGYIVVALMALMLGAGPIHADSPQGGPHGTPGAIQDDHPAATDDISATEQAISEVYDTIMDDVNAVIDAMGDLSGEEFSGFGGGFAPRAGPSYPAPSAASGSRSHKPATPARQGPRIPSPVVVELFTAQGCGGCPPAQDLLGDLAARRDVLALSWHVDYWDYLGWPDSFARPEFSNRQKGYNRLRGARALFTPQFVIGGEMAINESRPADLMAAIRHEMAEGDHISVTQRVSGARTEIELTPLGTLPSGIAVQLVRYLPRRSVEIGAGDNNGRVLQMHNVVVASEVLARWDGKAPLRLSVTLGAGAPRSLPADTRHVLIVQHMPKEMPAEILATVRLD
ncbi:MAG: DUF1223 domain-containing protein [Paracoccus sp. (in: a-proteobacteria)]|nr:DUF1223 domain-containing protein [Paracoccus sp. (in: a-proteobacteria)]